MPLTGAAAPFTSPETVALLGDPPVRIDDDTLVICFRFRLVNVLK